MYTMLFHLSSVPNLWFRTLHAEPAEDRLKVVIEDASSQASSRKKKKNSQFVAESLLFVGAYPAGVARSVPQKHDIDSEAHTEHVRFPRLPLNVFPPARKAGRGPTSRVQGLNTTSGYKGYAGNWYGFSSGFSSEPGVFSNEPAVFSSEPAVCCSGYVNYWFRNNSQCMPQGKQIYCLWCDWMIYDERSSIKYQLESLSFPGE